MNRMHAITALLVVISLSACTDTTYAPGYTQEAFDTVQMGDSAERVLELLGEPLSKDDAKFRTKLRFSDRNDVVYAIGRNPDEMSVVDIQIWDKDGELTKEDIVTKSESSDSLVEILGNPSSVEEWNNVEMWSYTRQTHFTDSYYYRVIYLDTALDAVIEISAGLQLD